jgi:hypothetical protein
VVRCKWCGINLSKPDQPCEDCAAQGASRFGGDYVFILP